MGLLKKIISALKTEDDGYIGYQPPYDENGEPVSERRKQKRVKSRGEFCVFIACHESPLDMEKAPFLLADIVNFSEKGGAFTYVSNTACTPYNSETEEELKVSSMLWLIPNTKVDFKTCSNAGCDMEKPSLHPDENIEPIKSVALWVKPNQFGCVFKDEEEKIQKMIAGIKKSQA